MVGRGFWIAFWMHWLMLFPFVVVGQGDEGFIYGKVTTHSSNHYIGQIRWGDEEVYWHDIFNSIKKYGNSTIETNIINTDNIFEPEPSTEPFNWDFLKIWEDRYSGQMHQFSCRFGDIKSIIPEGGSNVRLIFKNDHQLRVSGGSNDIGTLVKVMDYEIGEIEIPWQNIHKVEFFDGPGSYERRFGNPLYGTVITNSGQFSGFIHWDQDERLSGDQLDGIMDKAKISLPFGKIDCIERDNCASIVKMTGKSTETLTGTNDVDCTNRGIIIYQPEIGTIEVPWENFTKVCFDHQHKHAGAAYRNYPAPRQIRGSVQKMDGKILSGFIIFDKDESWDFEHLEGLYQQNKYIIPFRNIASIIPKNLVYSHINLKSGVTLLLGELQDVSGKNEGLWVFERPDEEPVYIRWSDIEDIHFD